MTTTCDSSVCINYFCGHLHIIPQTSYKWKYRRLTVTVSDNSQGPDPVFLPQIQSSFHRFVFYKLLTTPAPADSTSRLFKTKQDIYTSILLLNSPTSSTSYSTPGPAWHQLHKSSVPISTTALFPLCVLYRPKFVLYIKCVNELFSSSVW